MRPDTLGNSIRAAVASLLVCLSCPPLQAQPDPPAKSIEVQNKAFAAMDRGDYPLAERLLREQLDLDKGNFVIYYNLACVRALQDDGPGSAELLVQAIEHGFIDLNQLKRDPQLAITRLQPAIQKLLSNWPEVLQRQVDANLKSAREYFKDKPKPYIQTRDEKMRLAFLSAMDAESTTQARADIARLYDWGIANVFPDLADPEQSARDAWCVVVLPTPKDFQRWAVSSFGQAAVNSGAGSGIGGSYMHDTKRLVAQDLGATLRHEFFHVLHWRDNVRRGHVHAIWVQEGLCSLVEDYETDGDTIKPVANWRTNISKRLLSGGKLMPIKQLASIPRERFTANSPLANYGQARTVFLYLYQRGKLKDWYQAYSRSFSTDPTGVKAIEEVLNKPIADVDKDYRAWVRSLPMVAEQIKPGQASIGAEVDPGSGDGPIIATIVSDRRGISPAKKAGLKVNDVITAIDGKPTRDLNELLRILGECEPGDEVEVSYRRGSTHATTRVTLIRR